MSRIEKALEKASWLRGPVKDSAQAQNPHFRDQIHSLPAFEVGEPIIDESSVDEHVVCIRDPYSPTAEQYKKLRARIFMATQKDKLNSLLVTSSREGEGKTLTAVNLAITISQAIDHTVLLIDADLRRPTIHTYLGLEPRKGLSEYLQSKVELSDVLVKTGIGKLVLLPAGAPPENPAELLASEKFRDLVKEMKYRYDDRYVIIDSPPLLLASDAIHLGEYIDGVIFVVQAARTSPATAAKALSLIKNSHVIGTVFNNVPSFISSHNNNSYYYRYRAQAGAEETGSVYDRIAGWIEKLQKSLAQNEGVGAVYGALTRWIKKLLHR